MFFGFIRCVLLFFVLIYFSPAAWSQAVVSVRPKEQITLTLIPPSRVTEQIDLDIRAGFVNHSATPISLKINFYLDLAKTDHLLYQDELSVPARSAGLSKFHWPALKHSGLHKIIVVCRAGHKELRSEKVIEILSSGIRSTKKIDGAFAGF